MNRLIKKRMLIISISLALLLLINISVSYSYYLGKVVGNESDTTLSFKSAGIIISYENNSGDINVGDIMPGWSATKNFSLSSNILETDFTSEQTKLWYEIILYIDQNDFPSNLITYTLTPNETIVGNGTTAEARTSAGIETGTNDSGISLGLGYFTVGSNKHDYSITFNYVDNGSEYSNYPDNLFSVHIGAKVVVSSSIIIDLDGGSIDGSTTKYVSKGGTINLPIPTKDGYIFNGWAIMSGDGIVDGNNVTVNDEVLNISAIWKSKERYTALILNMNGGESNQDTINNIKTGEIFTLETPTKEGYVFRGWELLSGEAEISGDKIVSFNETVKIQAIWEYVVPEFTYTGTYTLISDSANDWRIKFLTSGTLNFTTLGNADSGIDVFLVGGGGAGGSDWGGGGGGGYTATHRKIVITYQKNYDIVIGSGGAGTSSISVLGGSGGASSAFSLSVSGGQGGGTWNTSPKRKGGNGGSGGGAGGDSDNTAGGAGASNGGSGGSRQQSEDGTYPGGTGQGTTTREFSESTGTLYAGGGGGYGRTGGSGGGASGCGSGAANTGGGGGGCNGKGGNGGSGIVIIRNARS